VDKPGLDNVFTNMRTKYHLLSPVQKRIADFIMSHSADVILYSIGDLAEKCRTSETTIMRFLRKVDFRSYQVFKVKMAQDLTGERTRTMIEDVRPDDGVSVIKEKVLASTSECIGDLRTILGDETLARVVDLMVSARRILFVGLGATGLIAADAFYEFAKLGLDVHVSTDPPIMNILAVHATPEDLMFAVSHSGRTREILDCARMARENGVKVVAITSYGDSPITEVADFVLLSSTNDTEYRSDAMLSRIVQMVIIDILYVSVILKLSPKSINNLKKSQAAVQRNRQ
jgi:RpiR family carbohydrate utilization transcriptional regulator